MKRNKVLVKFSIYLIEKIWKGKIGKNYNKKRKIICRFYPTCSDYGILALKKYGFIRGWKKILNRVKRCNLKNTESCVDYA